MKRLVFVVLLAAAVAPNTGCCIMDRLCHCGGKCCLFGGCGAGDCATGDCGSGDCASGDCGPGGCGAAPCASCGGAPGGCANCCDARRAAKEAAIAAEYNSPIGPQVTYPYYTNRGPRDFLAKNPRGIGP